MSMKTWLLAAACVAVMVASSRDADAQVFGSNLVVNGDAETGSTTGFTPSGDFSAILYNQGGYPGVGDPGVSAGGQYLFTGGNVPSSSGMQVIDISAGAANVDAGTVTFSLSALLGGYSSQGDNATVSISFLSSGNFNLGGAAIGPVTPVDRNDQTGLLNRETSGIIPIGTRSISLMLQLTRTNGSANDGYADNLSLVLNGGGPVAVPGPIAGAGIPALFGLAGMMFALSFNG